MRFNTRISTGKGVNFNLSKSGMSINFGLPGMNVTVGKNGVTVNRGIPGTYIRQRKKILNADGTKVKRKKGEGGDWNLPLPVLIGQPTVDPIDYSSDKPKKVKKAKKTTPRVHSDDEPLTPYEIESSEDFDAEMARLERGTQQDSAPTAEGTPSGEADNSGGVAGEEVIEFNSQREATINIARLAIPVEERGANDTPDVLGVVSAWLKGVTLPLEFAVNLGDFDADSGALFIDLDLPEIEDLPDEEATRNADGTVVRADVSDAELREDYVQCVFGLGVFIASHMFDLAAPLQTIVVSAFTQRRDDKGDLRDDYIYSVKYPRAALAAMGDIAATNPFDVAMACENRCRLSRSREFDVIEPYAP